MNVPFTAVDIMMSMIQPGLGWTGWKHFMMRLSVALVSSGAGFAVLFKYFVRAESTICMEYDGPLADWRRYEHR